MTNKHLALYGLKYDPFLPAIPVEDLWTHPVAEAFYFRVETLVLDGGFALITAEPGLGKSKALQQLAARLSQVGDVHVGVMSRPQSKLGDLYRELGDLFGVDLSPANRYGGFKALRARFRNYIKSTLFRPVLLVDEAQEVDTTCLNELRILSSAHFDSECLLTTVLCGDKRLSDRFRTRELLPLGSRIRTRLTLEPYSKAELRDFVDHILVRAGAPGLMSEPLRDVLVDHAAGNPRVLVNMAADLLAVAAHRGLPQLDEHLFVEVFAARSKPRRATR
jgi:type II secretory pathway predicted ATPase ExeA